MSQGWKISLCMCLSLSFYNSNPQISKSIHESFILKKSIWRNFQKNSSEKGQEVEGYNNPKAKDNDLQKHAWTRGSRKQKPVVLRRLIKFTPSGKSLTENKKVNNNNSSSRTTKAIFSKDVTIIGKANYSKFKWNGQSPRLLLGFWSLSKAEILAWDSLYGSSVLYLQLELSMLRDNNCGTNFSLQGCWTKSPRRGKAGGDLCSAPWGSHGHIHGFLDGVVEKPGNVVHPCGSSHINS